MINESTNSIKYLGFNREEVEDFLKVNGIKQYISNLDDVIDLGYDVVNVGDIIIVDSGYLRGFNVYSKDDINYRIEEIQLLLKNFDLTVYEKKKNILKNELKYFLYKEC